jgi:phosphoribosyl-ATP pyrophosphohydrolase
MSGFSIESLEMLVAERAGAGADQSYTRQLLDAGAARCAKKFGEEAVEAALAAVADDRADLVHEAADVLYHLIVLLRARQVSVAEVMAELERRTARSGLAEKAARGGGTA